MGYHRAGFDVVGVDLEPQPHYPFEFHQADALTFPLDGFDAIHASPPCQAWSTLRFVAAKWRGPGQEWPRLIAPTRGRLSTSGVPWVIENVMTAPLTGGVVLCGLMFGLRTHRHRRFESSELILQPSLHDGPCPPTSTRKRKRDLAAGFLISVTGHVGSYVGGPCMGIEWMTGEELAQAIPPAYSEYVGSRLIASLPVPNQAGT